MKKLNYQLLLLLFLVVNSMFAQTSTVSGTVSDSEGQPLPGANVFIKGTSIGGVTDFDGKFQFKVNNVEGKTLVISYLGFVTKEMVLNGSTLGISISLLEDASNLDEVVVLGSSVTQERKKLGNAITTVKSAKLVEAAPVNITSSLQGKVPGAQITQNSGDPAGGFSIRLRGPSTIKGSSEPLYIVDGVIASNLTTNVTNLNVSTGDGSPGQNRMVDINPNDIDNINILNGAAAAAIYGSRASNGVVIITTKKGQPYEDGPKMSFKTTFNVNTLRKKLDLNLVPEEFEITPGVQTPGRLWPIVGYNPDTGSNVTHAYHLTDKFSVTRYDYQDQIFQTGFGTDNHFSIKNGNDKMNYMASLGYTSNEGIVRNTNYKRFSSRINFGHKVADWISYDIGLYFSSSHSDEKPDGNVFWSPVNSINITNNVYDITERDEDGNLLAVEPTRINPLSIIETFDITQKVNRFIPNLHLTLRPIENLTINQILGYDTYNQKGHIYIPVYPYSGVNPSYYDDGYLGNAEAKVNNWNYDITAEYDFQINDDLESTTTAGYSFQASKLDFEGSQGRTLDTNGDPTVPLQLDPTNTRLDIYGVFLQETLSYKNRFFLTLAGRMDGATNFDVDTRNNFYPKVSGSYVLSNESFWGDNNFFDSFRLRASYGEAGNLTAISPYERFGSYSSVEFLGDTVLQQDDNLGNEDLKPERTKEFEVGAEMRFFENRASLLFTYYKQDIDDLIVSRVLAPSIGGSSRTENVGSMTNKGIEIYANVTPVKTQDLTWDLNFNFSSNKNKVLETDGGDITVSGTTLNRVIEGQPLGVFYGTYYARNENGELLLTDGSTDGVNAGLPQQERGDIDTGITMRDENGQPTGDVLSKVIGDPNPDFILGVGTDFKYKNFTFSMLWESVQGFDVLDYDKRTRQGVGVGKLAAQELTGELPRGYISAIYPIEEFRIEDGSFTKLREISIGYEFPSLFNNSLQDVRISLIGRNLISFDNFFSYDPETNSGGQSNLLRSVNFGNVPIPSSFAISLNANF